MTKRSNYANQSNINMARAFSLLSEIHPKVASIIEQVRNSTEIGSADKSMIEEQLIAMCGTLNEAKKYSLVMGRWNDNDVYSDKRASVASERRTIRNETVFTIVPSLSGQKHWVAYIDLPIDVAI